MKRMALLVVAVGAVGACSKSGAGGAGAETEGSCELAYAESSPDGSIAKGLQVCSPGWRASRCNPAGTGAGAAGVKTTDYVFTAGATCEQRGYQDCDHGRGSYYKVCPAVAATPDAASAPEPVAAALPAVDCTGVDCVKQALALGDADRPKSVALFAKACADGQAVACAMVGTAYEKGDGVATDGKRALEYDERSCTLGYTKGCYNYGLALANGVGGAADLARALPVLEKACADGAWKACGSVGSYRLSTGDAAGAKTVLAIGCKNSDSLSCEELAKVPAGTVAAPAPAGGSPPTLTPPKVKRRPAPREPHPDEGEGWGPKPTSPPEPNDVGL